MEDIIHLHVVGYKNSGKTTLISNWVKDLKQAGLQVAVIKHHGHGAKLAMPDERKDSMQYLTAGADASIVAGGGYTQHILQQELNFTDLMNLAKEQHPDIVLIEGYKEEDGPKVVLVKEEQDWETLRQISNIELVIGIEKTEFPTISAREDRQALKDWLETWIQLKERK